jgi:hypothetical protein
VKEILFARKRAKRPSLDAIKSAAMRDSKFSNMYDLKYPTLFGDHKRFNEVWLDNDEYSEGLRPTATAFRANIGRISALIAVPSVLFFQGRIAEGYSRLAAERASAEPCELQEARIQSEYERFLAWRKNGLYPQNSDRASPDWRRWTTAEQLALLSTGRETYPWSGLESIIQSCIVMAWTTVETLAGDLLVAAVNASPGELSRQTGRAARIKQLAGGSLESDRAEDSIHETDQEDGAGSDEGKSVSLNDIHRYAGGDFDLSRKMGFLLRRRWKFTTLSGIRRAYSRTFSERSKRMRPEKIDQLLSSQALDTLKVARNVIVHNAGYADSAYEKDVKHLGKLPKLRAGEEFQTNGEFATEIVLPALECCRHLIGAVDGWVRTAESSRVEADTSPGASNP